MDLSLPDLSGAQVIHRIKIEDPQAKVLVLTVHGTDDSVFSALSAGAEGYLVKDADSQEFFLAIESVLKGQMYSPDRSLKRKKFPLHLLLVEDNENNRQLFQFYLKGTPHSLDLAGNGLEAVNMTLAHEYDMIFMDIEMPIMDGYEATRIIRNREKDLNHPRVPICALTAHAMPEYRQRIMEAGCTHFITKPFTKAQMLEVLEEHMNGLNSHAS